MADLPKDQAGLMRAIYERIVVAGPEIVRIRLTSAAYADGLALAQMLRGAPIGVGRAITTYRVPIERRVEWVAATRRQA